MRPPSLSLSLCKRQPQVAQAQAQLIPLKPQLNNDDYNDDIDDFNCSTSSAAWGGGGIKNECGWLNLFKSLFRGHSGAFL